MNGYTHEQAAARRGFTLVELLAVTAVIAVLAALLLPAASKARRAARAADSLQHLRMILSASVLFAGDHEGRFHNGWGYERQLQPYLQDPMEARTVFTSPNADQQPVVVGSTIPITYSVHGRMMAPSADNKDLGQPVSLMRKPALLVLVADGIQAPNNSWQSNFHFQNPSEYVMGSFDQFSDAQLKSPLEDNAGPRGVGPDTITANAGWFRYCNNGSVAAVLGDGHATLIPKGQVLAGNLIAF